MEICGKYVCMCAYKLQNYTSYAHVYEEKYITWFEYVYSGKFICMKVSYSNTAMT